MSQLNELISRNIRASQEVRRATVLTDQSRIEFNTAAIDRTIYVVDVDIGAGKPIRNVPIKSISGLGGRAYCQPGKAVEIQSNEGGRWIVIGPSDRIRGLGSSMFFDESNSVGTAGDGVGFRRVVKAFDSFEINGTWGEPGFGNTIIIDASGNEVT